MIKRVSLANRIVFVIASCFVNSLVLYFIISGKMNGNDDLGYKAGSIFMVICFTYSTYSLLIAKIEFKTDEIVYRHLAAAWLPPIVVRSSEVRAIYRSALPYMGRADYVYLYNGNVYVIPTDFLQDRKAIPGLLEQSLGVKISES